MPLKNISPLITPQLLRTLASMGQGEEIVLADANFPTTTVCKSGPIEIRADGVNTVEMLEAILDLLPLEDTPVHLMTQKGVSGVELFAVKQRYLYTCSRMQGSDVKIKNLDKDAFLKRAKCAYAVVHTRENVPCGTLIMMKGNVKETRDIKDTKDTSNTNDTKKTKYIKPTKYISYTDSSDCGDPIEIVEDDW